MKNEIQKTQKANLQEFKAPSGEIVQFDNSRPKWFQICEHVSNERELVILKQSKEIQVPGVRKLAREFSPKAVKSELAKMLKFVGVAQTCPEIYSPEMIELFFALLRDSSEFYHLSLPDVWLALKRGSQGFYSKTYGKPNLASLREWLEEYEIQRIEAVLSVRDREKDQFRDDHPRGSRNIRQVFSGLKGQ